MFQYLTTKMIKKKNTTSKKMFNACNIIVMVGIRHMLGEWIHYDLYDFQNYNQCGLHDTTNVMILPLDVLDSLVDL